jgi:DNA-binding NarL/FixJ family response regulator
MRILVVDDHPPIRDALAAYLARVSSHVCNTPIDVTLAETLADAFVVIDSETRPDLVFLDLNLDRTNHGAATFERFQQANHHRIPVVIYTGLSLADPNTAKILLHCYNTLGAQSIMLKSAKMETMLRGLPRILEGERWMPEDVLNALLQVSSSRKGALHLSPTQMKVALCLTRGLTDKRIADELGLSHHYVRQVLQIIFRKLGVHTRLEAAFEIKNVHG